MFGFFFLKLADLAGLGWTGAVYRSPLTVCPLTDKSMGFSMFKPPASPAVSVLVTTREKLISHRDQSIILVLMIPLMVVTFFSKSPKIDHLLTGFKTHTHSIL